METVAYESEFGLFDLIPFSSLTTEISCIQQYNNSKHHCLITFLTSLPCNIHPHCNHNGIMHTKLQMTTQTQEDVGSDIEI